MLLKIAWRNIWRHRVRSLVVITAIALGLTAGVFASAFVKGMMESRVETIVKKESSHFQIHAPKFRDEFKPKLFIANATEIKDAIKQDPAVVATCERVITMAMIASPNASGAIKAVGILPEEESKVSQLNENVIDGKYFQGINRNPILISEKTAENYKVKIGSKVVLTFQDINGEIVSSSFRVVGIYNTGNPLFDEKNAYVRRSDLQSMLGIEQGSHEIAVLLNRQEMAEPLSNKYQKAYPKLEVLPWMDLQPGMRYMIAAMDIYTVMIVGIILVALL